MADEIEIQCVLPAELQPITIDEAVCYMAANGHVMILHRDGQMFRITEPWER